MFAYTEGPFPYHTVLALAFLFGFVSGLYYECHRILRLALHTVWKPKGKLLVLLQDLFVFVQDLSFFLTLSVFGVLFLFVCNRGQLRLSILLLMGCGFAFYLLTLGRLLFQLHKAILTFLYKMLCFLYRYTVRYLILFLCFVYSKTFGRLCRFIGRRISRWKGKIAFYYGKRSLTRLIKSAEAGFPYQKDHIILG